MEIADGSLGIHTAPVTGYVTGAFCPRSSMAEHRTCNAGVGGSSPPAGLSCEARSSTVSKTTYQEQGR